MAQYVRKAEKSDLDISYEINDDIWDLINNYKKLQTKKSLKV